MLRTIKCTQEKLIQVYSTRYVVRALVTLLGKRDASSLFPAFLDADGKNLVTDT